MKRGACDTLMSQINRLLENLPNFKNIKSLSTTGSARLIYCDSTHFHPQEQRFIVKQQRAPSDLSIEIVNALKSLSQFYKSCLPQNQ